MNPYHYQTLDDKTPLHGRDLAKRLRRLRRHARRYGFRIARVFGDFSVITILTAPPRAVCGLRGVDLETIEIALGPPSMEVALASRRKPPGESAIREFIDSAGPDAVLAVIDQMTRPPLAAAAE
jgi:hypothetical protein